MRLRSWVSVVALAHLCLQAAPARSQETDTINIATAGLAIFNYLPITLAERIGAFRRANLKVTINDFQGGQRSIEALVGGSVDASIATYDNTILLQTKGVTLTATVLINRSIGAVIAVADKHLPNIKSPKDVKGFIFGVSSPGSATHRMLNLYLAKGGLTSDDISAYGLGGGANAVARIQSGRLDGFVHSEPVVSQGLADGKMKVLVDGRTEEGMKYLYGGYIAATAVVTTPGFIQRKPAVMQKFASALIETLKWMQSASLDEIMSQVPAEFYGPSQAAYRSSLAVQIPIFSTDGMLKREELDRTYASMVQEGVIKREQPVAIEKTYDTTFAEAANKPR